ncbi:MAG: DUF4232 domain-containing protein [Polyangiaceae bacterium]
MRTPLTNVCEATMLLFGLAAMSGCGPSRPAHDASNTDETVAAAAEGDSSGEKLTPEQVAEKRRQRQEREAAEAAKDPDVKKGSGAGDCNVANMADLQALLSQPACEVRGADPSAKERDLTDVLSVKATPDSATVEPGGQTKVTVVFTNKGKTPLPLDFKLDPEARFLFELYTAKGTRAELPPGDEPMLPESAGGPTFEPTVARVTFAPGASARAVLSWSAVKYKWASKEKARGAVRGHGYPREAAGPLPKGKYVLHVVTPLVGVFEGIEHSLSQPAAPVEVRP